MSDNLQSLRDDLDYMKALAREGRQAPLLGGQILLTAGLSFGTASLVIYSMVKGYIPATQALANGVWAASMAVFFIGLYLGSRRAKGQPGHATTNNRGAQAGWKGVGFAIFAFGLSLAAASWRLRDTNLIWLFAPFVLVVYGAGWTVAAAMSGRRWMGVLAVGSYLGGIGMGLMAGSDEMFLGYAACLFLLAAAPGVVLMRAEPSETI